MLKVVTLLSTLRDPTQLRRRQCATRQMYANSMQKICKNYAKSFQNLCKKDTVIALHNHIYMDCRNMSKKQMICKYEKVMQKNTIM